MKLYALLLLCVDVPTKSRWPLSCWPNGNAFWTHVRDGVPELLFHGCAAAELVGIVVDCGGLLRYIFYVRLYILCTTLSMYVFSLYTYNYRYTNITAPL